MDRAFPAGLPGSTALYLCLYAGTLAVHAVLLSYVLAGSAWLAVRALRRGPDRVADLLRDWLPFALGAAITAGVAPLLFLQVLYQESFYTANLLLLHRWMAVVPVLIAGFYLLYLGKSGALETRPRLRGAAAIAALLCFAFVAWSFTENHLLSLDRDAWADFYGDQRRFYTGGPVGVRLGIWLTGAFPLLAAIAGWQLWYAEGDGVARSPDARRLAVVAIAGLLGAGAFAALYARGIDARASATLTGPFAGPWLVAGATGIALQLGAWSWQLRAGRLSATALAIASAGGLVTVLAVIVGREAIRLSAVDLDALSAIHARTAGAGGMPLFLILLVANTALIAWAVRLVRRGLARE